VATVTGAGILQSGAAQTPDERIAHDDFMNHLCSAYERGVLPAVLFAAGMSAANAKALTTTVKHQCNSKLAVSLGLHKKHAADMPALLAALNTALAHPPAPVHVPEAGPDGPPATAGPDSPMHYWL
jgi:hypothetical protein